MPKQTPKLNSQILEEASAWFIDLNDGEPDATTREEFNTWLRRSPEHVRAFLQMSAFMEDAGTLRKSSIDIEALIARARQEDNVFPLELGGGLSAQRGVTVPDLSFALSQRVPGPGVQDERQRSKSGTDSERQKGKSGTDSVPPGMQSNNRANRTFWPLALAASLLLTIGIGVGTWLYTQRNVYTTGIGEQRSLTLEDGSRVELNSRSRVRLAYTEHQRTVELLDGQALFRVAKNPARPFIVRTGDTSVRAVGTAFDVYRKRSGTVVTVIEGKVAVANPVALANASYEDSISGAPASADTGALKEGQKGESGSVLPKPGEVLLAAGEQLTVTPRHAKARASPLPPGEGQGDGSSGTAVPEPKPVDVQVATAWTQQKLIFQDTPLREVVEEFNRYNRQQLVIRDASLYDFHVTGVFPSTDSSRMLEFLQLRLHITTSVSGDEIEITRPADVRGTDAHDAQ